MLFEKKNYSTIITYFFHDHACYWACIHHVQVVHHGNHVDYCGRNVLVGHLEYHGLDDHRHHHQIRRHFPFDRHQNDRDAVLVAGRLLVVIHVAVHILLVEHRDRVVENRRRRLRRVPCLFFKEEEAF